MKSVAGGDAQVVFNSPDRPITATNVRANFSTSSNQGTRKNDDVTLEVAVTDELEQLCADSIHAAGPSFQAPNGGTHAPAKGSASTEEREPFHIEGAHAAGPPAPGKAPSSSKKTTYWDSVFHLYIVSAGPSVLSMPKTFMGVGYVYGSLVVGLVVVYYWSAMRTIVRIERQLCQLKRQPQMTYFETMYHAFDEGPSAIRWLAPVSRNVLRVLYTLTWTGALGLVLIAQNVRICIWNVFQVDVSVQQASLCSFPVLLALTLVHRLEFLAPVSMLGNAIVVLCIGVVVFFGLRDADSLRMLPAFGDVAQLPNCLAAILFTINATGLVLPLKNEMAQPKRFDSSCGVLTTTYLPLIVLYILFNALCCMKYGDALRDSVIENLPADSAVAQSMIFLFAVALCFQYPLITYVAFDNVWNNMLVSKRKTLSNPLLWEYVTRVLVFLVSFFVALTVPNINVFLAISGTIGTAVDSMIYPAVAETLVMQRMGCKGVKMKAYYLKNACILVLAVILMIVGLSSCALEIMSTTLN